MTEIQNQTCTGFAPNTAEVSRKARAGLKKALATAATYIPALIIFGLIALYYIQLSHMGM